MRKILISGTRTLEREKDVKNAMAELQSGTVIICHGDATGTDAIAREYARRNGIDQIRCPANWEGRQNSAGPWRNRMMLRFFKPDEVWAFPIETSVGTVDMIAIAQVANVPVRVF